MKMNKTLKKRIWPVLAMLMAVLLLAGCGGSSDSDSTGTLSVALTDAACDDCQAVYVTIDRVDVHTGDENSDSGKWITVAEPGETYNLLDLANGVMAQLGQDILPTGSYGQLRLILGETPAEGVNILGENHPYANYVIDSEDNPQELKLSSQGNTGEKIVHGFEIYPGQLTELLLDFDASRSVVKQGNGQLRLKPTIKISEVVNLANITGIVTDETTTAPVMGVYVSAQTTDVGIATGTITSDAEGYEGQYGMLVEPGTYPETYNVVVTATGYAASCQSVEIVDAGTTAVANFTLTPLAEGTTGTVSGTVTIPDADAAVDLSVLQDLTCGDITKTVIVQTDSVATGVSYEFNLPAGTYTIVAESEGYVAQSQGVTVMAGVNTTPVNFDFTTP